MTQNGIFNLLKPAGMTSHDAVYFIRKLTGLKKVGHSGTLDPMAVGVLPVCLGQATRVIDYLDPDEKSYRCEFMLGIETDTWDIWGKELDRAPGRTDIVKKAENVTFNQLQGLLEEHLGDIRQLPPMFSSVRVKGRRLYEYARDGVSIEVAPRDVTVSSLRLLEWDPQTRRAMFDISCSKGTYIRSICHEVGQRLNTGAVMTFLARTATGAFDLTEAISCEELSENWQRHLLPPDYPLNRYGSIEVAPARIPWIRNGGSLRLNEVKITARPQLPAVSHYKTRPHIDRAYRLYSQGEFLAMMLYEENRREFIADKVFCV
jgi:tRNA pseudouridine55 synthase